MLLRTISHVSIVLVADLGVVLFVPSLLPSLVLLASISATNLMRARYMWEFHHAVDLASSLFVFHAVVLVVFALIAYAQGSALRQQFLVRLQLQQAKDARIEQLDAEKQRLDYERAFALKRAGMSTNDAYAASDPLMGRVIEAQDGGNASPPSSRHTRLSNASHHTAKIQHGGVFVEIDQPMADTPAALAGHCS